MSVRKQITCSSNGNMNCSARALVLISCPLFPLQSFCVERGRKDRIEGKRERRGKKTRNRVLNIVGCPVQNQVRTNQSLNALSLSLSLFPLHCTLNILFVVLLGGETETPTASDSTLTTVRPERFPSSLNTLLPSVCQGPQRLAAAACNTDQPQH